MFRRQLESLWALKSHKYRNGNTKIRYVANLLYQKTTDKHGDSITQSPATDLHPDVVPGLPTKSDPEALMECYE